MDNNKKINLTESTNFNDDFNLMEGIKPLQVFKGHGVLKDSVGNIVLQKDNLIVLRGRTFALEKMFGVPNDLNLGYKTENILTKKICLFKAGKGGTIEGQPFNVIPVIPADCRELGQEIPFRISSPDAEKLEGYYQLKTIPGTDVTPGEDPKYGYYAKTFDSIEWGKGIPPELEMDITSEDEVYIKLTLAIDKDDFATVEDMDENGHITYKRSTFMNEIALCIANHVKNDVVDRMDDIEIVTRLCFESEPLFNNTKTLTFEYYIFA